MAQTKGKTPSAQRIAELEKENVKLRLQLDALSEEPMPEIHELWMELLPNGQWRYGKKKSSAPGSLIYGPYHMVPGILPLAELIKYGVWISYNESTKRWRATQKKERMSPPRVWPLQAQWDATRIARTKAREKAKKRGRDDKQE